MKKTYDLRRRPVQFSVGDKVWKKNKTISDAVNYYSAKLAPKFIGPFTIHKKTSYNTYELRDDNNRSVGIWHVQDLKPDNTDSDPNI